MSTSVSKPIKNPLWGKICRELVRPLRQLVGLPHAFATYFFGAWYFDTFLASKIRRTPGHGTSTNKAAVYVLYSPDGVYDSHIVSLSYLVQSGFGVVAVSNAVLSVECRQKLVPLCIEIIERPNFGYDFGAYRQGVLAFESRLNVLDSLLLVNDSTWFPILNQDWIQQAAALDKDFVGAALNYGISRSMPESVQDFVFRYDCSHKNFHYSSFALLIGRAILRDPDFLLFWKRLPLTSQKNRTVRRGEIGLTHWVLKKGFSHGETLDIPRLDVQLQKLDFQELCHIVQYMIIPENGYLKRLRDESIKTSKRLSEAQAHDLLRKFILVVVAQIGMSYAIPYFNIFRGQSMFLKKTPLWLDEESKIKTLTFIESLQKDSNREILLREAKYLAERLV